MHSATAAPWYDVVAPRLFRLATAMALLGLGGNAHADCTARATYVSYAPQGDVYLKFSKPAYLPAKGKANSAPAADETPYYRLEVCRGKTCEPTPLSQDAVSPNCEADAWSPDGNYYKMIVAWNIFPAQKRYDRQGGDWLDVANKRFGLEFCSEDSTRKVAYSDIFGVPWLENEGHTLLYTTGHARPKPAKALPMRPEYCGRK